MFFQTFLLHTHTHTHTRPRFDERLPVGTSTTSFPTRHIINNIIMLVAVPRNFPPAIIFVVVVVVVVVCRRRAGKPPPPFADPREFYRATQTVFFDFASLNKKC